MRTPRLTTQRAKEYALWLDEQHRTGERLHYHQLLEIARCALHDLVALHNEGHGVWSEQDAIEDFSGLRSEDKEKNS